MIRLLRTIGVMLSLLVTYSAYPQILPAGFDRYENWTHDDSGTRYFADINGDGKSDLITRQWESDLLSVSFSTGVSFEFAFLWSGPTGFEMKGFADVNSDGRQDIVGADYKTAWFFLSTGSSFGPKQVWHEDEDQEGGSDIQSIWFSDVTGDGRIDFIRAWLLGIRVAPNIGTTFGLAENWTPAGEYDYDWGVSLVDLNGDAKSDLYYHHASEEENYDRYNYYPSTGSSFDINPVNLIDIQYHGPLLGLTDLTADLKPDLFILELDEDDDDYRKAIVARSLPEGGFEFPFEDWSNERFWSHYRADVTGDGRSDLILADDGYIKVARTYDCNQPEIIIKNINVVRPITRVTGTNTIIRMLPGTVLAPLVSFIAKVEPCDYPESSARQAGSYEDEKMIDVINEASETGLKSLKLYPNPVQDILMIKLNAENAGNMMLELKTATGASIRHENHSLQAGSNFVQINTSLLRPGVYFLSVAWHGGSARRKVIVK